MGCGKLGAEKRVGDGEGEREEKRERGRGDRGEGKRERYRGRGNRDREAEGVGEGLHSQGWYEEIAVREREFLQESAPNRRSCTDLRSHDQWENGRIAPHTPAALS